VPDDADRLFVLYAIRLCAKGPDVTASDVHDAWTAWMQEQDPDHEAQRPYDDLPPEVQAGDTPFLTAIREAANASS
jgi:hypothetical protein